MRFETNIDLNKNELQKAVIHKLAAAPSSPVAGQIYYNTTDNLFYGYNGSVWKPLDKTLLNQIESIAPQTLLGNNASGAIPPQALDAPTVIGLLGLGSAAMANTGTGSGNVPVLDGGGKLSTAILPALAISDTFVVASQAAMLALTAEPGDIAVRTDLSKSFILRVAGASTLANWQELLTPTDTVTSVNGATGAVTIAAALRYSVDIGNASATVFVVTHNLNTRDVVVSVRENASPYAVGICDVEATTVNTVTVRFSATNVPANNAYRVTVLG